MRAVGGSSSRGETEVCCGKCPLQREPLVPNRTRDLFLQSIEVTAKTWSKEARFYEHFNSKCRKVVRGAQLVLIQVEFVSTTKRVAAELRVRSLSYC